MRELLVPIFQHGECKYESPSVKEIAEFWPFRKKRRFGMRQNVFFNPHKVYVESFPKTVRYKNQAAE